MVSRARAGDRVSVMIGASLVLVISMRRTTQGGVSGMGCR